MTLLGNLLWAFFGGGLITALEYFIAGLICSATVIGLPFGLQCFKISGLALAPFGKDFSAPGLNPLGFVGNALWLALAGIWIFLSHVSLAMALAVSIIGLPFALQHIKLAMVALAPFGVDVRTAN
jgi:uncharacterized membrane protein YccF (DUF307 family)